MVNCVCLCKNLIKWGRAAEDRESESGLISNVAKVKNYGHGKSDQTIHVGNVYQNQRADKPR